MYPTPEENVVIHAAEKLMKDTMSRYDPSHDAYHVERVRKTALQLAKTHPAEKKPDLFVVELAALLHDVLDKKYVSSEQYSDPYNFFFPFFQDAASAGGVDLVTDGRAKTITKIIENVSWSTEKKLVAQGKIDDWHRGCIELHCVQDADRLDAIGAFGMLFGGKSIQFTQPLVVQGILRCAAYSAVTNHALHTPPGDPAHESSAIQHFHDKLLHIRERLKTEEGKRLAEKRHKLMCDFLDAIEKEYDVQA
ncbi:hypothetical protein K474DRAFT_193312 [Panus rudis PR-1116 ss-1]|nr:hypothetical protein K474DRAFT_193312 [Panus rudis PR-1116 ss-1]